MTTVPSFKFKPSISAEDFAKELSKSGGAKRFTPGQYRVTITDVAYHENKNTGLITCASDPTWINVAVTLTSADGREKKNFIQVPTVDVMFTGKSGKKTAFVFKNLQAFLESVGIKIDITNYGDVVKSLFTPENLDSLVGEELDMVMRYKEPYIKRSGENEFNLIIEGKEYIEKGETVVFSDRESAKVFAARNLDKAIDLYPDEVLTFLPAPEKPQAKKAVIEESWD